MYVVGIYVCDIMQSLPTLVLKMLLFREVKKQGKNAAAYAKLVLQETFLKLKIHGL